MTAYLASLVLIAIIFMHGCEATDVPRQDPSPLPSRQNEDQRDTYVNDAAEVNVSRTHPESNTTQPTEPPLIDRGLVSRQQYKIIKITLDIVIKPIVCLVGLVLNVIGICVLLQPALRHGFYVYLAALSIADSGYLLCGLLRSAVKFYGYFDPVEATNIENTIIPYPDKLIEIAFCKLGAYCIMLFSLDRLIAIFRPLKVKDFILSRHSKSISFTVGIVILVFHIPKVTNFEYATLFDQELNMSFTGLTPVRHEDGSVMATVLTVYDMTYDILFTYLPPVFICVVNICIIVQIQKIRNYRKRLMAETSNSNNIEQQKLIITVFVISGFFLMVYIPLIAVRNLTQNDPGYRPFKREHYLVMVFPSFISLGWSINAAIDFTVYLGTSVRFRLALYKMCCGRRRNMGKRRRCPVGRKKGCSPSTISHTGSNSPQSTRSDITSVVKGSDNVWGQPSNIHPEGLKGQEAINHESY
ncbi:probable G-protein coupled receptor B0563.6 [Haliotis rufescens]|uniref:probable G-protein coupled receptor B0563.6 n=1 Tax=Haliotis rufescens TaxID=6454 RepID=UPI00201F86B5|nr:probable G-protein coupled receptor B0563.6 [Haliotis rufescens]